MARLRTRRQYDNAGPLHRAVVRPAHRYPCASRDGTGRGGRALLHIRLGLRPLGQGDALGRGRDGHPPRREQPREPHHPPHQRHATIPDTGILGASDAARGDCEDYALYKKRELIRLGIPPEQLLIAAVLDKQRRIHAVLVVRTGSQDLVLDNLTSRIVPWNRTGYTFLRLQDPDQPSRWVAVYAGGMFPLS